MKYVLKGFEVRYHGPTDTKGARLSVRRNYEQVRFYVFDHASARPHVDAVRQYLADTKRTAKCEIVGVMETDLGVVYVALVREG